MKPFRWVVCCAALGAALSFSYALATSRSSFASQSAAVRAQSRYVGQTLRLTNPFFVAGTDPSFALAGDPTYPSGGDTAEDPDGFDLGDALAGVDVLRYITAAGGYLPYSFIATPLPESVGSFVLPTVHPRTGKVTGPVLTQSGSFLRFKLDLSDFIGSPRVGKFKLNVLPSVPYFRFAVSQLPTALQGQTYFTNVAAIGGLGGVRYEIVPNSITIPQAVERLEQIGLTLAPDGTLFGRPAFHGVINFSVVAIDAAGKTATARIGGDLYQRFTLIVEENKVVSTELSALSCTFKGNSALATSGALTYTGVLDPKGDVAATLAGSPFVLRVGGAAFSGSFDDKGKVNQSLGESGKLSVNFSAKSGRFSMKLSGVDLAGALTSGRFVNKTPDSIILAIETGAVRTCEVLSLPLGVRGTHFEGRYRMGASACGSVGGSFQILTVAGNDAKLDGEEGDRWVVRFIGMPRSIDSQTGLGSISGATVRIGGSFSQQVNLALKSVRYEFKATSVDPGIFRLLIDPRRFVHRLETNILTTGNDTAIPIATGNTDVDLFTLGLDVTNLVGESGRIIAPDRRRWTQR